MKKNVIIKDFQVHLPKQYKTKEYYINNFKEKGEDITGLLEHLGRDKVFIANKGETSLTLAQEAIQKCLDNTKIDKDSIEMVIFVSETPEYLLPSNALKINYYFGFKNAHIALDMNSNCSGLISTLAMVKSMMVDKNIKRGIVVGSLLYSLFANENDSVGYPSVSDSSCAFILELVEEKNERGIIESNFYTNPKNNSYMMFPACGMSKIFDSSVELEDKKQCWIPHDVSYFSSDWNRLIRNMLVKKELDPEDISYYCMSQFSEKDIYSTMDKLNVDYNKTTFTAREYGYTGCNSPFFALKKILQNNSINKNDYIVFCSVSGGYSMSSMLYKC